MEIQQLSAFLAVAEELHFGRAAEKLHIAQPPVTRAIQALERDLGVRLFDRSTRSVRLTAAGELLVRPARGLLEQAQACREVVAAVTSGVAGKVRLAYAGPSSNLFLGRLARAVKKAFPGIHLEIHSHNFAQLVMGRLVRGEVDIAIGRWDHPLAGIQTRLIDLEELVVAVPETHFLAKRASVSFAEFAGDSFISLPLETGSVLIERLRSLSHSAGFEPAIVQYAPDTTTILSLVSAEVGSALTVSSVIQYSSDPHLRFVRLSEAGCTVEARIAWYESPQSQAVKHVLALADDLLANGPDHP